MNRSKLVLVTFTLFVCTFLSVQNIWALSVENFRPGSAYTEGFRYETSENLPEYTLELGTAIKFAYQPLELTPGGTSRLTGIMDHLVTQNILVGYGITDQWSVSLDAPVALFYNIAPAFIANRDKGAGALGDILLSSKFTVFDAAQTATHLGLAVQPFVSFPSGSESKWLGDASFTGGMIVIGDWKIKSTRLYMNVGTKFRKNEVVRNLNVKSEMVYGGGVDVSLSKKHAWNLVAEVGGSTSYRKFVVEDITSPAEVTATVKKKWGENRRLTSYLGGGMAITNGYGLPLYRVMAGLSYAFDLSRKKKVFTEQIQFDFNKANIKERDHAKLQRIATYIKKHPRYKQVEIEGHTDSIGSHAYNDKLSLKRAKAMQKFLIGLGTPSHDFYVVGYGKRKPIAPNDTAENRQKNRRSVFTIMHGGKKQK